MDDDTLTLPAAKPPTVTEVPPETKLVPPRVRVAPARPLDGDDEVTVGAL